MPRYLNQIFLVIQGVILASSSACGNDLPIFSVHDLSPRERQVIGVDPELKPSPIFEQSPKFVYNRLPYIFVTTAYSWLCRAPNGLFDSLLLLSKESCTLLSAPARLNPATKTWLEPKSLETIHSEWRRSYDGVMGGVITRDAHGYELLVTVDHGENKNEKIGSLYYPGSVNAEINTSICASGQFSNGYQDCWASYNGFVNWRLWRISPSGVPDVDTAEDRGPLVWPSMGYIDPSTRSKQSTGVRHPSVLRSGKYLYVFYTDQSVGRDSGRQGGLHVARASLDKLPDSLIAYPYYNGQFATEEASLPAQFETSAIQAFLASPGGRASELWPGSRNTVSFAAARLANTAFFIGIEEVLRARSWSIQLRLSRDLVAWSAPVVVPSENENAGWERASLHYPILVNHEGETQDKVLASDFWVLGTDNLGRVWRKRLRIDIENDR